MPTFANEINFMQLWTQNTAEANLKLKKFLLVGLDRVGRATSDVPARIKIGKALTKPTADWLEEVDYPTKITAQLGSITGGGTGGTLTFTAVERQWGTITAEKLNQMIRVGTYLRRPSDNFQMRVASFTFTDPATYTALVTSRSNDTLTADVAPIVYDILYEGWTDRRDVDSTRSLDRHPRSVGSQIVAETFEILQTRKNTAFEIVEDETEHQIMALINKLRRQEANIYISAKPQWSVAQGAFVYGNYSEESTGCGLLTWPDIVETEAAHDSDVYANMLGQEITKKRLDDAIRANWLTEYAQYKMGDWWILTDPITKTYIDDFDVPYRRKDDESDVGWRVDEFRAKVGKSFKIMVDEYMPAGTLEILNFSDMSRGYYKNDRLNRKELPTFGRYEQWLISYQTYGVVARKPRQIVKLWNMPQTSR